MWPSWRGPGSFLWGIARTSLAYCAAENFCHNLLCSLMQWGITVGVIQLHDPDAMLRQLGVFNVLWDERRDVVTLLGSFFVFFAQSALMAAH